jgi:hypothetical protein
MTNLPLPGWTNKADGRAAIAILRQQSNQRNTWNFYVDITSSPSQGYAYLE